MSKTPKDRPTRKATSRASQPTDEGDLYDDDYYDEDQEYKPQRQSRSRAQTQQAQQPQRSRQRSQQNYRPRSVQPQSGISGGYTVLLVTMGLLILVGAVVIAYLLGSKSGSDNGGQTAATVPTVASDTSNQTNDTYPEVPRIEIADFINLYSDMSKRPYLIDVRPKDQFDQEHIKDAISFPADQAATRIGELPKDRLIVAYCA